MLLSVFKPRRGPMMNGWTRAEPQCILVCIGTRSDDLQRSWRFQVSRVAPVASSSSVGVILMRGGAQMGLPRVAS